MVLCTFPVDGGLLVPNQPSDPISHPPLNSMIVCPVIIVSAGRRDQIDIKLHGDGGFPPSGKEDETS